MDNHDRGIGPRITRMGADRSGFANGLGHVERIRTFSHPVSDVDCALRDSTLCSLFRALIPSCKHAARGS